MTATRRRPSLRFATLIVALGACGSAQPVSEPPPSGGDEPVSPAPETPPPSPPSSPVDTLPAPVDAAPAPDAGTSNIDYLLSQPMS